jgi:Sedlin, N-terminal conserved region
MSTPTVLGYMTTTQIKFLLTVEDDDTTAVADQRTVDETIKLLFVKLHRLYVEYTLNPFSPIAGGPIDSLRFDTKVRECILAFNRTLH